MRNVSRKTRVCKNDFERSRDDFLDDPVAIISKILPRKCIILTLSKYGNIRISGFFNTVIVLWAFIFQVLSDGKQRSCHSAVTKIFYLYTILNKKTPVRVDTGNYCKARNHLDFRGIRELMQLLERNSIGLVKPKWLWNQRHAVLVDGFTLTMQDTPENQSDFPQPKKQKEGLGFPMMRACVLVSLVTGLVIDAHFCPYSGKNTGESALLRCMFNSLRDGDVLVGDRCYCSYFMIALLRQRGVDVCTRIHHSRKTVFEYGKRFDRNDRIVVWKRPQCPGWMDHETYQNIPETMTIRMIRFRCNSRPEIGKKSHQNTKEMTLVTTLQDSDLYTKRSILNLYQNRWNVELDIRHIKRTLNADHMRCKSPNMINNEFYTTLLGYNMIRTIMLSSIRFHGILPRQLSFTRVCSLVVNEFIYFSIHSYSETKLIECLSVLSRLTIPHRPGREEPRTLKRNPSRYPWAKKPRHQHNS